jgi:hypothetical protein
VPARAIRPSAGSALTPAFYRAVRFVSPQGRTILADAGWGVTEPRRVRLGLCRRISRTAPQEFNVRAEWSSKDERLASTKGERTG